MKKRLCVALGLAVLVAGLGIGSDVWAASKKKKKSTRSAQKMEQKVQNSEQDEQEQDDISITFKPFFIFTEAGSRLNHYAASGWMGDISDLSVDGECMDRPYEGKSCMKISYSAEGSQGWAGIFWQDPPNNWGTMKGGFDLTGAKKFIMWIRGERGGERISGFTVGGILDGKASSDTDKITLNPMVLTTQWEKIEVNVAKRNLKNIISGLSFSITKEDNPEGAVFYLDEVHFE